MVAATGAQVMVLFADVKGSMATRRGRRPGAVARHPEKKWSTLSSSPPSPGGNRRATGWRAPPGSQRPAAACGAHRPVARAREAGAAGGRRDRPGVSTSHSGGPEGRELASLAHAYVEIGEPERAKETAERAIALVQERGSKIQELENVMALARDDRTIIRG